MKKTRFITTIYISLAVLFVSLSSCQEEIITYPKPVDLLTPAGDSLVEINPEATSSFVFEWGELPEVTGTVHYNVLFDKEGTYFEEPVYVCLSDGDGLQTRLSLSHAILDSIAVKAGIPPKKSATVKWAVDAITTTDTITSMAGSIILKRPTSLGETPTDLYIYGSATSAGDNPSAAIHFHRISDGSFDLFTTLKPGTFKIVNAPSADAVSYYINEGELFLGEQEMSYASVERLNLLQVDFLSAEASSLEVISVDVIIPANGNILTSLSSQGNNIYSANNVVFNFLQPGGPDSPDWLTWVEERYRFRIMTTGGDVFYGSFMDASMFGVYIPGMTPYSFRPEGEEPEGYFNVYAIPADIANYADWAGCYKFRSSADGTPVNISLNLDPEQEVYTHTVELAK